MGKRKVWIVLLALLMVFVLMACGTDNGYDNGEDNGNGVAADDNGEDDDLPVMTMDEVSENDGQDGSRAYVVVEGIVYDVTDSDSWTDGMHQGHQAGQDLTEELQEDSPHGSGVLDDFEPVGRIEE